MGSVGAGGPTRGSGSTGGLGLNRHPQRYLDLPQQQLDLHLPQVPFQHCSTSSHRQLVELVIRDGCQQPPQLVLGCPQLTSTPPPEPLPLRRWKSRSGCDVSAHAFLALCDQSFLTRRYARSRRNTLYELSGAFGAKSAKPSQNCTQETPETPPNPSPFSRAQTPPIPSPFPRARGQGSEIGSPLPLQRGARGPGGLGLFRGKGARSAPPYPSGEGQGGRGDWG